MVVVVVVVVVLAVETRESTQIIPKLSTNQTTRQLIYMHKVAIYRKLHNTVNNAVYDSWLTGSKLVG